MILPGQIIEEYVDHGLISIEPDFDSAQVRPFGLRVHLDEHVLVPEPGQHVDLSSDQKPSPRFQERNLQEGPLVLAPGGFCLGSTLEAFRLAPSLLCRLDGRSTIARLGLLIYCSAAVIDSNHSEHRSIVLELANVGPFSLTIPSHIGIGMVTFERVTGEASLELEQTQYEGQRRATAPNLDFSPPAYQPGRK